MITLLARFLEHKERRVKTEALQTLETLVVLAKDDEESKEMMGKTKTIKTMIKLLSSDDPLERQPALLLLLELSKSESVSQRIGTIPGAILMLITMKYNKPVDAFAAEKAEEMLKNLEKGHKNIKQMAENGFLEPLLSHLVEGRN